MYIPLNHPVLPFQMVFMMDGSVALAPYKPFKAIFENSRADGVCSAFYEDFFTLYDDDESEDFDYKVAYLLSAYPTLKRWLVQQELISPFQGG